MQKPKQPKLSKAQIAQQMEMKQDADRFKKLIREEIFPVLKTLDTMARAQQVAEITKSVMVAKMNDYWSGKTVEDLGLIAQLEEEGEFKDAEIFKQLVAAMSPLTISDAHKLLEGMGGAFDGYARKLSAEKKMEDLSVDEIIN